MVPYYILLHEGREEIEWHHTQQMRPFTMLFNHRTLIAIDIIEYIQGRQREE